MALGQDVDADPHRTPLFAVNRNNIPVLLKERIRPGVIGRNSNPRLDTLERLAKALGMDVIDQR